MWRENFAKSPPPKLRKEPMVPILAYGMQEKVYGGLSHSARSQLLAMAKSIHPEKRLQKELPPDSEKGTIAISCRISFFSHLAFPGTNLSAYHKSRSNGGRLMVIAHILDGYLSPEEPVDDAEVHDSQTHSHRPPDQADA